MTKGLQIVSMPTDNDLFKTALSKSLDAALKVFILEQKLATVLKLKEEKKEKFVQARRKVIKDKKRRATRKLHKAQTSMANVFKKAGLA